SEQIKGQLPKGKVYRLPTVIEWNFVSHPHFDETAGTPPDKETSLLINKHAWIKNNSKEVVHPVGSKPPNRFGIHDMLGNVHEFCLSSSGELKRNDQSIFFFEGNAVFQGGSFNSTPRDCLSYYGILPKQGAITSALKQRNPQISQGTINLLAQIQGDIEIDFYCSRNREGVPVNLKNQADRVLSLLQQFDDNYKSANGEIILTVIDPKPDTDEEETAEKSDFGIKGRLGNTLFYTGIKIIYQGEEENINFLHESESFLEREIITTLYGLTNDDKQVIGLINSMD
ncbi:uncharacterized protein METZ01_LOCUS399882, partial [marine metagenome]